MIFFKLRLNEDHLILINKIFVYCQLCRVNFSKIASIKSYFMVIFDLTELFPFTLFISNKILIFLLMA